MLESPGLLRLEVLGQGCLLGLRRKKFLPPPLLVCLSPLSSDLSDFLGVLHLARIQDFVNLDLRGVQRWHGAPLQTLFGCL